MSIELLKIKTVLKNYLQKKFKTESNLLEENILPIIIEADFASVNIDQKILYTVLENEDILNLLAEHASEPHVSKFLIQTIYNTFDNLNPDKDTAARLISDREFKCEVQFDE